jgi:triacylglycerol lipase
VAILSDRVPFNKELALKLLKFSELTAIQFKTPWDFYIPLGYDLVTEIEAVCLGRIEKFGFILKSNMDKSIVIAFRGSESLQDWQEDAMVAQVPFCRGKHELGHVHRGFLTIYESCKDQIFEAYEKIQDRKDRTVYVTGHSLGAGLATLHALDVAFHDLEFKDLVMYNFASPRVGDLEFKEIYDCCVKDSVRFVNDDDIVPNLPRSSVGRGGLRWQYYHVHSPVTFVLRRRRPGIEYNHSFEAYRKGMLQMKYFN